MKNSTKIKIVFTLLFIALDILVLPSILEFPIYLKEYTVQAPNKWMEELDLVGTAAKLLEDSSFRKLFLVLQPLLLMLLFTLLWKDTLKRKDVKLTALGGPPSAGSGQFGTSRWLTNKEIEQKTTVWYTDKTLSVGGPVIHIEKVGSKYKVCLETNDTHTLNIGTSRSGKTRTGILPSIWATAHSGESMIINDPKGELYEKTNKLLTEKGYEIVLLDFRNPSRGNRWNPMQLIVDAIKDKNESLASEAALDMAHTIVYQRPRTGDPIWADGTKAVIASLTLAIAQFAHDESQKHLTSVYNTLIELGTPILTKMGEIVPLNNYFKDMSPGSIAKTTFGPAAIAADKTKKSFYAGAATDLMLFSDPGISNLTAYSDHNLADVGRKKTAVFMIVPDEKNTRHVLASLYVDQTYQALVQLANENKGRIPVRVNNFLDEFGNMPPINGFDNKITVAAGRGIRFHLVVQDLGQLKEKYGDKARIIKNNTHTWIYLLTKDQQTAEEISKMTGKYTVETQNLSSSIQVKSYSHGTSSNLTGRALLTPDEIMRNPYGEGIVFLQREFPARTNLPDYEEGPAKGAIFSNEPPHVPHKLMRVPLFIPGITDECETEEDLIQDVEKQFISILDQLDNGFKETAVAIESPMESPLVQDGQLEVVETSVIKDPIENVLEVNKDDEVLEDLIEPELLIEKEPEVIEVEEIEIFKEVVGEEDVLENEDIFNGFEEIEYETEIIEIIEEPSTQKKFSLDDLD
jgi:type IV secretion system protein VirD4